VARAVRLSVACLAHVRSQRWGRIVNVAFYAARVPEPFELDPTATGKSQDELVTRMAQRAPIDVGRMGTSEEVAAAIVSLCSTRASWIAGVDLSVDGGTIRTAP